MKEQVSSHIPTPYGNFVFQAFAESEDEYSPHLVITTEKTMITDTPVNVRVHSECITGDLFHSKRCDCGQQLVASMQFIQQHSGIIIYLRQEGRGIGLISKLKAYNLQDKGMNTLDANLHLGYKGDERTYEMAVEILHQLGIYKINLLTNNPDKITAFDNTGIELVARIPLIIKPNKYNKDYLATKRDLMGHLLNGEE